jgi:hypothetical protein
LTKRPQVSDWQTRSAAPIDKPLPALPLPISRDSDPLKDRLLVGLFYRGHTRGAEVAFSRKEPGQRVVIPRQEPPPPRVIVRGEQGDAGSVVFILDCSGSMGKEFDNKIPMDIAKPALRATLRELSEAKTYRVSLWLYGHRLGWNNGVVKACEYLGWDDATRSLLPPNWCQPETQFMSEDVSRVWPRNENSVGKLTPDGFVDLDSLLGAAQGFGVTPLFYSIIKVLEEEPMLKIKDRPRHLIVLTDGLNKVNEAQQKPRKVYKFDDVQIAVNEFGRGVKLHVVGFGEITADPKDPRGIADAREWRQNVRKIASYRELGKTNTDEFREYVRSLIGLKRYEVALPKQAKPKETELNQEITIDDHDGQRDYEVRIIGSKQPAHLLTLYGGEAIDLYIVDPDGPNPRLRHKRYVRSSFEKTVWANLSARGGAANVQGNASRFHIGVDQPLRVGGGLVDFPISIQNADETQFSRRPAEAWVQITPLGDSAPNKVRPLVFYDLQFENGRPVPVLLCRAQGWPNWAQRARVNLFFKPEQTRWRVRQQVDEADGRVPNPNLDVSLAAGGKVQFTVAVEALAGQDATQITVKERCVSENELGQVKVEIETTGGAVADMIQRSRFYASDEQEVQHRFVYKGKSTTDVGKYRVRITTREDLEQGSYKLDEPVEVSILSR